MLVKVVELKVGNTAGREVVGNSRDKLRRNEVGEVIER